MVPFVAVGILCVLAGGLLAAVTAPAPTEHGAWAVAYLVLVGGVAQAALGVGQALSTTGTPSLLVAVQLIGWNLGNAAVLVGTLNGVPALADVGAALLGITLILLARGVPGALRRPGGVPRWFCCCYGLLIAVLLVSLPVGLVLLRLRG
ncbi:MAG: hypothetical protein ACR2LI_15435 [Propionibacteriaceae bacterium]